MARTIYFPRGGPTLLYLFLASGSLAQNPSPSVEHTTSCVRLSKDEVVDSSATCAMDWISRIGLSVAYYAPSMRGREVFGRLIPYGQVWRTGENAPTLFTTEIDIKIGELAVPAGTYSLYSIPSTSGWKLIINKRYPREGDIYDEDQDLGRTNMTFDSTPPRPVETLIIKFRPSGTRAVALHIMWENTDVYTTITAQPLNTSR
jgi:Protein of unknown function (DUF2911)